MRKRTGRMSAAWLLAAALTLGQTAPALAQEPAQEREGEEKTGRREKDQTDSGGQARPASESNAHAASPSDAQEEEERRAEEYEEENLQKKASPASALMRAPARRTSATGDLWEEWLGAEIDWEGEGSETNPYKITSLSELMGLSEAVAQGEDFEGRYFELQQDIDLGNLELNQGCWNPIGWYQNRTELGGAPDTPFKGSFDGAGNTIYGLKFTKMDYDYSNLGLFGRIEDAQIRNLNLEAEEVSGKDNVGLLAGCVEGDSRIYEVTVNGVIYAEGDGGGIAGEVTGGSEGAVIENCRADSIVINSENQGGFVGGIAGNVQNAFLVDVTAITMDGDSSRIQGKGYVGGIAGRQNETDIYNVYVAGTIGGNGTRAVGGITGLYESGNLVVARFDGEISRTNNGAASQEGTFIGTREPGNGFRYGTGADDNVSFLYASSANQAKNLIGSGIADDNTWTMDAHIGYFTDYGRKYVQVAGITEATSGERFFYEELEDGIRYIITQKTGQDVDIDYGEGQAFKIDHYAPGNQGEPVRGYLVSVPRIDTKNANGTFDNDVASLTAIPEGNNSYYRPINQYNPGAVAAGSILSVTTAAKNQGGNRYQMVYDEDEPGKVKAPTFTDEAGEPQPMTYVSGGSYTFEMPESDTELKAEYVKVTTELTMEPEETEISVVQIRTGDRKNPEIAMEVRDQEGTLIARYLNGSKDSATQVLPVRLHAEHNGAGDTADRTVLWSIDDRDLLHFEEGWTGGYTLKDARVIPNLESGFIQDHIQEAVQIQADGGYEQAISNTIYRRSAVVTASTNPATSTDGKAVTGTCKVTVSFRIQDQTTIRVEGLNLNQSQMEFYVTRILKGDRKNPVETYQVTAPFVLSASLSPSQPFYKNVTWADQEGGRLITLAPSGTNQQECQISVVCDTSGNQQPAWIQNIVMADDSAKEAGGGYGKLSGSGRMTEMVTATSEDQTHGIVKAQCQITIYFQTDDQTVIHPEGVALSQRELAYDLSYRFAGDTSSQLMEASGFGRRDQLTAVVLPDLERQENYEPYNRNLIWESSDPAALSAENGLLVVKEDAPWIQEAMKQPPYQGQKQVTVTARTEDGNQMDSCRVTLNFKALAIEADRDEETFELTLKKTGRRSSPAYTWSGGEEKTFGAVLYPESEPVTAGWSSGDPGILSVTEQGMVTPVVLDSEGNIAAQWLKEAISASEAAKVQTAVYATSADGGMTDQVLVTIKLTIDDQTYSSSGGSGGGGGGGGGSSFKGASAAGSSNSALAGQVTGTWSQNDQGKWSFSGDGRSYADEWAYIYNPYAQPGQSSTDWFHFGGDGFMTIGWYKDGAGNLFYLNPLPDNTQGRMLVGWNWIDDNGDGIWECYYFNPVSDGTKGRLLVSQTTPDGYTVNDKGQWIMDGAVQVKGTQL